MMVYVLPYPLRAFPSTDSYRFPPQDTISVHRPNFYSQRFLDFMSNNVFKKIQSRECLCTTFVISGGVARRFTLHFTTTTLVLTLNCTH